MISIDKHKIRFSRKKWREGFDVPCGACDSSSSTIALLKTRRKFCLILHTPWGGAWGQRLWENLILKAYHFNLFIFTEISPGAPKVKTGVRKPGKELSEEWFFCGSQRMQFLLDAACSSGCFPDIWILLRTSKIDLQFGKSEEASEAYQVRVGDSHQASGHIQGFPFNELI